MASNNPNKPPKKPKTAEEIMVETYYIIKPNKSVIEVGNFSSDEAGEKRILEGYSHLLTSGDIIAKSVYKCSRAYIFLEKTNG